MTAPNREYTITFRGEIIVEAASEEEAYEKANAEFTAGDLSDTNYDIEKGECVVCGGTGIVTIDKETETACLCTKESDDTERLADTIRDVADELLS